MNKRQILKSYAEATIDNWMDPQSDIPAMERDEAIEVLNDEADTYAEAAADWVIEGGSIDPYEEVLEEAESYLRNYKG